MFGEKEECLQSCVEFSECFACNETYEEDIQNCPCTKNCPSEYFIQLSWTRACEKCSKSLLHTILKLTLISDGCPCPAFDCSILDELSESCSDLKSNENYQICYEKEKKKLNECLDGCGDSVCQKICSLTFHGALENCPCGSNCPCKINKSYI